MKNLLSSQHVREKLPWQLLLIILFVFIVWQTNSNNYRPTFVPGAVLFSTAAVGMYLSLRMESDREARHTWIRACISLILGILLIYGIFFSPFFLEKVILIWIVLSILLILCFRRSSPIWAIWIVFAVVAGATLTFDYQRWLPPVTVGIAICELILTTFILSVVPWRLKDSALLRLVQNSMKSEISAHYYTIIAESKPIVRKVTNVWLSVIIAILLGTHLSRMGFGGNLGFLPAFIALFGDLVVALILAFVLILPLSVSVIRLIRSHEGYFIRVLSNSDNRTILAPLVRAIYIWHIQLTMRLTEISFSLPLLLKQGLITGLPIVAIFTAFVPLLGTNWFFNTEEWATIGRDKWAALNTDRWRMKMVSASNPDENRTLEVNVPGLENGDFSFIVVGDPGQGGLSQRELAKRIVKISQQEDVRFVLVSSDVVYPNGEMKDYEAKFWSPFSGLTKPIVAIPGNHDWYDGLDSFSATFFTKDAARAAITARNNDARADRLIDTAETLRQRYELVTQLQTAPYFKIVSRDFVLLCVDTGVLAQIDQMQMDWLRRTLEQARGKTKMVVLGHPFFAWNRNKTIDLPGLVPILDLLRKENVSIVMAGDIHDLEYYLDTSNPDHPMYHFVNGGGGAYLSINRSFGSPEKPITSLWAYYPTAEALSQKLNETVPSLIRPLWWFAREKNRQGHVFAADVLSTALDQDKSPFLNSFLVVNVESSRKQVRIIPYGVHGRLKWSEFALSADKNLAPQEYAEWVIPMSVDK